MVIVDGGGRIRKYWDDASKTYDSDMVTATKDWYEDKLNGAGVFADAHFSKATKNWDDPVFYCPLRLHEEQLKEKMGKW